MSDLANEEFNARRNEEFQALLEGVRSGSQEACRTLFNSYVEPLRRYVRRRFIRHLQSVASPWDVVLIAWEDAFSTIQKKNFESPEQFLKFILKVSLNKLAMLKRHYLDTQKRDLRRQEPLDERNERTARGIFSRDPDPATAALVQDEWNRLLATQPPLFRHALELRREGFTWEEIEEMTKIPAPLFRHRIRKFLHKELTSPSMKKAFFGLLWD
jgi:DNA-directed RNA polymerase specialized sigma24 family protein